MDTSKNHQSAIENETLRRFLQHPDDRNVFVQFFTLCLKISIGSLSYLQRRGYRLPVGPHNSYSTTTDLAYSILGTFLRYEKGVQFGVIFSYFAKEGIVDFQNADAALLMSKFRALLLGHVRNELFAINRQEYPEAANLKRRFNQILAGDKYSTISANGDDELICLNASLELAKSDKPLIPQEILAGLVEEAYLASRTIEDWCAQIFALLTQRDEYAPAIPKHRLLAAAVKVSGTYLELDAIAPAALPTPTQLMRSSEFEKLRLEVVTYVRTVVINRFFEQGKISMEACASYERAVDLFLADKSNGDSVDLLPKYFRETMPESEHEHYLMRHKYIFETIMNRAEEEFVERIKKSSTIPPL